MSGILIALLALTPRASAGEVEVLVAPFQAVTAESRGISALLHGYLESALDQNERIEVVPVDRAGYVFDASAEMYLESCPPTDQVGCALVVAESAGVQFALTGTVEVTDDGYRIHVWVLDGVRLRQVDFEQDIGVGEDDLLMAAAARHLLAVVDGDEGLPIDERFRRSLDQDEIEARIRRDDERAALDAAGSQVGRLGDRTELELERRRYTEEDIAAAADTEGTKPWERLDMSPREYLRYQNSGKPLFEWRALAAGRQSQIIVRPSLGMARAPMDTSYYGRYVRSATTLETVQQYAWQAVTMGSGPSLGLGVAYGVLPTVEVGLVGGTALGVYTADISVVDEGDVLRDRTPQTYSAWSTYVGADVIAGLMPTWRVRPVVGGGVLLWFDDAIDDHVLPPSELETFPAPMTGLIQAIAGVEARVGPRVDVWAHVPFLAVAWGGEVALQDEGGDYLSTREQPPALNAVGAGVSAGVQVRLLGVKPQKSGLDDLGD